MKLAFALLGTAAAMTGCLVIDDDDDVRYYRPGSRYVARPYVDAQQYYAPPPVRRYQGRAYVAPAEAYDDRRYLRDDRRRYYHQQYDD